MVLYALDAAVNSGELWFVNFYSPGCSHCHDLAPTVCIFYILIKFYSNLLSVFFNVLWFFLLIVMITIKYFRKCMVLFYKNTLLYEWVAWRVFKGRKIILSGKYLFFFPHSGETLLKKWMDYFELVLLTVVMIECFAEWKESTVIPASSFLGLEW